MERNRSADPSYTDPARFPAAVEPAGVLGGHHRSLYFPRCEY